MFTYFVDSLTFVGMKAGISQQSTVSRSQSTCDPDGERSQTAKPLSSTSSSLSSLVVVVVAVVNVVVVVAVDAATATVVNVIPSLCSRRCCCRFRCRHLVHVFVVVAVDVTPALVVVDDG